MHKSLTSRIIGFLLSLLLTILSFFIISYPVPNWTKAIILTLAILQATVQSICFLNVLSEKGPRWNLVVFVSTLSIVLIIVIFSIWIMDHLNYNMMVM
jgi:cytochrome o ubiquinol oxidase operon protein cyoD